ncbi:hypothetical protein [Alistipes provencensis]|uniref:hypothetical protein n=1 Tax=Alistipes provencensis TaxID=1816676 RepID=UPI0007ED2EA1|nr:hypothetical protein [Alistipes provencensis]
MKEVLITIISAIGLGSLITFFIKRYDEKKSIKQKALTDTLNHICGYSKSISEFMLEHTYAFKEFNDRYVIPDSLDSDIDVQNKDIAQLEEMQSHGEVDCVEYNSLQQKIFQQQIALKDKLTEIRNNRNKEELKFVARFKELRTNISSYNNLLNITKVNGSKYPDIYKAIGELDVNTVAILLFDEKIIAKESLKLFDLFAKQLNQIEKIKFLINKKN